MRNYPASALAERATPKPQSLTVYQGVYTHLHIYVYVYSFSQALDVKHGILDNEQGGTLKRHMKDKNFVSVLRPAAEFFFCPSNIIFTR